MCPIVVRIGSVPLLQYLVTSPFELASHLTLLGPGVYWATSSGLQNG